jgi:hypothetical protein
MSFPRRGAGIVPTPSRPALRSGSRAAGCRPRLRLRSIGPLGPLLAALVLAGLAVAQPVERLERLEVSLWPEFDRPAMLVMLRAWLPADVTFPATVRLPLPAAAGSPTAVAYRGPGGNLLVASHVVRPEGDPRWVELTTPSYEVRLEYYAPLDTTRPERSYRFHWPAGMAVGRFGYDVLHPRGATEVEVEPPGTRARIRDGMTEERNSLGAIEKDDSVTLDLRYTKRSGGIPEPERTPATSPKPHAASPDAPATSPEPRATSDTTETRWLLLLAVSGITLAGGYLLGRRTRRRAR